MSGTRRFLVGRRTSLLALTVLALGMLFAAYDGVHRNSDAVRIETSSAILKVAATRNALQRAHLAAGQSLLGGEEPINGLGKEYDAQLSAASQNLAQVVDTNAAGPDGNQTVRTISSLVDWYGHWIHEADKEPRGSTLRRAYLSYADSTLTRPGTGIGSRLDALQATQLAKLRGEVSFGWVLWCVWTAAFVLCGLLAWQLAEVQIFLFRRFRRRYNPGLIAAGLLLVCGTVVLAVLTGKAEHLQAGGRDLLAGAVRGQEYVQRFHPMPDPLTARASPEAWVVETGVLENTDADIRRTALEVDKEMQPTRWWAGAIGWIPVGGTAIAALIALGLQPRIDEYRFRPR
jgi:hypothetical protein